MPLQIRRGTTAERLTITPLPGELIYDTTTEQIFVGDGTSIGGRITTGISIEDASDAAAALFTSGAHTGITFTFDDANNQINSSVSFNTLLENLNLNEFDIVGTGNINIDGQITADLNGNLTGNVTGAASLNVLKTGDTLSGDINWSTTGRGLTWGMNSDGASIKFYNVSDTESDSRLEFQTSDNGNEYFRWTYATNGGSEVVESMRLTPNSLNNAALRILGSITVDGDVLGNVTGNLTGNVLGNVTGNLTGDVNGSIFSNDSTLLVDGISGTIPWSVISGAPSIPTNISSFTNDSGYITASSDLTGSIFADDSTLLVDGVAGQIVGDINARLAGDLNVNGNRIVGSTVDIAPTGLTIIGSTTLNRDGNLTIVRNQYNAALDQGFVFAQHHSTPDAVNTIYYRTRGTSFVPTAVQTGDELIDMVFVGHDGTNPIPGLLLTVSVEGIVSSGRVPSKLTLSTDNGIGFGPRAELSSQGVWKVNTIQGLTDTLSVAGNLFGDVKGSVYADDSARILDGTSGRITTPSVTLAEFLKLPVYADDTTRDSAIPSPEKGMVIFIEAGTLPVATNQMQVHNGTNWVSL